MGKLEFLAALKRAMAGLPPELQAKTLAYYEQRFVDAEAIGRVESDVSAELGDPKKIAITLRANAHMQAFAQQKNPRNVVRVLISALGLAIFNLFMLVPAIVYSSLLATMYACALAFYVAGIAITAGGLAGVNELVLDGPLRHMIVSDDDDGRGALTTISIGDKGIRIWQDKDRTTIAGSRNAGEKADDHEALAAGSDKSKDATDAGEAGEAGDARDTGTPPAIRRAESVAGRSVRIATDLNADSRATGIMLGLAMVVGSIILFLISLVVSRYTIIGLKRYFQMNASLLKG
jgi:uncharacterized membrane protein